MKKPREEGFLEQEQIRQRLSQLPQIGRLLNEPDIRALTERYADVWVRDVLRSRVAIWRARLRDGASATTVEIERELRKDLEAAVAQAARGKLRPVINGTGVVVHTNLGRAPLSSRAQQRVREVNRGYCNLEYDLDARARGGRMAGINDLICALTGAEAAYAVNNNAAAIMLALQTLAQGKEVVISRGELVEIGGSFRIPDVMRESGVILKEVGTTNRTHLRDYEAAINENTGALLKVHQSNFVVRGFTKEVDVAALVKLGKRHGLPVVVDLGSGAMLSIPGVNVEEPTLREVVQAGADLVTCSCDKLMGGPQAGIVAGRKTWVAKAAKMPITRAFRVDKLVLAALEATLQSYKEGEAQAYRDIPVLSMLHATPDELLDVGKALLEQLSEKAAGLSCTLVPGNSAVGGGALPEVAVPTIRLVVAHESRSANTLESFLRAWNVPIIGVIEQGKFMLDLRTIAADEQEEVIMALCAFDEKHPNQLVERETSL